MANNLFKECLKFIKLTFGAKGEKVIDAIDEVFDNVDKTKPDNELIEGPEALEIDAYLRSMVHGAHFRGSVLIVRKGETILSKGYGEANSYCRNTPSTVFQIASLTKQFTAAAIMKLYEAGKIGLEEYITRYIPVKYSPLPISWQQIKVKHLLSHTSGIPSYTDRKDYWDVAKTLTVEAIIAYAKKKPLNCEPGKKFEYSNTGYTLLGTIIEQVSGCSYADFLKNTLFIPAGMTSSGVHDESYSPGRHTAKGYCLDYDENDNCYMTEDDSENICATFADGSVYSTVEDLAKWSQVLDGKISLLSPDSIKRMTTPVLDDYGFGLTIDKEFGQKRIHHDGDMAGFKSEFWKYPNDNTLITILCNNINFYTDYLIDDISQFFYNSKKLPTSIKFQEYFED